MQCFIPKDLVWSGAFLHWKIVWSSSIFVHLFRQYCLCVCFFFKYFQSINCYHGVAALGHAFNDKQLQYSGQVLLAMELLSVREYWQVRRHNREHFPPIIQDTGVCGQIAEDSFYVYTLDWPCAPNRFPMRHACLVGIQVIPITAVSKYWVDQVTI